MFGGRSRDAEGVADESKVVVHDVFKWATEEVFLKVVDEVTLDEGLDAEDNDVIDAWNGALTGGPRAVDGCRARRILLAVTDLVEVGEERW
jgi:hypothetical protein